jgi:hypothetical protein
VASSNQRIAALISDAEKLPFFPVDAWAENQESAILQTQSIANQCCVKIKSSLSQLKMFFKKVFLL